jgi:hypothetical protein
MATLDNTSANINWDDAIKGFKEGPAIWKNRDVNNPVFVEGKPELYNGRWYVSIKGTASRIPFDEVSYDITDDQLDWLFKELNINPGKKRTVVNDVVSDATNNASSSKSIPYSKAIGNKADDISRASRAAASSPPGSPPPGLRSISSSPLDPPDGVDSIFKKINFGRAAVLTAGIVDLAMESHDKQVVKENNREAKRRQQRKDKRYEKYSYAGTGYRPETFNNAVQDMFNQRTGHYKMGNSKFR